MENLMNKILEGLRRDDEYVLVTMASDAGSTPRNTGTQMLVSKDGLACGTIGGGIAELNAIKEAQRLLATGEGNVQDLTLDSSQTDGLDMPCGGDVSLLYTPVKKDNGWGQIAEAILKSISERKIAYLALELPKSCQNTPCTLTRSALFDDKGKYLAGCEDLVFELPSSPSNCEISNGCLVIPAVPPARAIIFGGGHVASALVPVLSSIGFPCIVFENRPDFAREECLPAAQSVLLGNYNNITQSLEIEPSDYVFIMTHNHEHDYAVLEQVLRNPTAYVGFMGSRKKIAKAHEHMRLAGIPNSVVDEVHMPIGIDIMSETPAEIAISIAAECILHRANSNSNQSHKVGKITADQLLSGLDTSARDSLMKAPSESQFCMQDKQKDYQDFSNPSGMSPELMAAAVSTLTDIVKKTPTTAFRYFWGDDKSVYLKLENLQYTGAFKVRGAYFKMSNMIDRIREVGVTTCSAGNHAQGVAASAMMFGAKTTVFIPSNAPIEKIQRTEYLGAKVKLIDGDFEDAKAACEAFSKSSGCEYIPPYDDYAIIAGQGTIAHEILDEVPDATTLVVPVGGGGLIAGIAYAAKQINPNIRIYGVQTESAPSMKLSLEQGHPVEVPVKDTIADGIHVARPGDKTFAIVKELVDGVVTVSEEQISNAMDILAMQEKIVAEGAGATAVAAVIEGLIPAEKGDSIVCVISGGNVSASKYAEIIASYAQ